MANSIFQSVMSASSSIAASASSSTAANSNKSDGYDVFINHRGPDVKNTLATYIYRRLISHGLRVFLDREEMRVGKDISDEIKQAIETASVHVAIFSPGYANSTWCLNELVLMLDSNKSIIPVFCNVEPSDLRWTKGKYGKALKELKKKKTPEGTLRYDSSIVKKWGEALSEVSKRTGLELDAYRDEGANEVGAFLNKIVESVFGLLKKSISAADYRVGLDEKVNDFQNEVLVKNPQVVGIVGVGGVGKTTLAKELFDRKRVDYSKFCFLSDVRENAMKGLLNSLQRQLLKSLTGTDVLINSIDEGIKALKKHLSSDRVFIILDDVDKLNQIDALLPVRTDLLSDSLVLITSRYEKVITSSGVENASIYRLTELNERQSRELFCSYAFNQPYPRSRFKSLVDNFLEACDRLPLLLKVIGSLLSKKNDQSIWKNLLDRLKKNDQSIWKNLLDRLKELPEPQNKFIISYESLIEEQQQMFLDTACFFIGQKRDTAIRIWEGSHSNGRLGFQSLRERCLLDVDDENNIAMHDLLRDFGKAVADVSLPRRLLHSTANKDMLDQLSIDQVTNVPNEPGTNVRGIRMVRGEYNDEVDASGGNDTRTLELVDALRGIDMRTLELVDTEGWILESILKDWICCSSLIWLRWNKCPDASLPSWIPMESLRVLQVSGSELKTLWEDESQVPLQLRELEINAPLSNIPKSIGRLEHLERIVVARFLSGHVHLTKLPEEFCHLESLKDLVLTECSKMKSLPDSFGHLWNLQHIDLSFCCNLERLPDSIGYLRRLRHINLSYCHDLERLPDSIGGLAGLQHIDLRGCHNLESLPDSFGELWDLRHINLSGCHDLQRLPDSFVNLRYLQHIDLQGCHNLQSLPDGFGDLMNLEHVNLSNCHDLEWLPDSFGNLRNLRYIDLSGCHNLERLPKYFRNFNKLKYLDVEGCSNLIIETIEITDNLHEAHQRHLEQLYLSDA